jgi:hypothetical protein
MSARHAKQQPTVQELKKRALALAALPRNRGWLELSQVLDLLHGHSREQGRAKFQDVIDESALSRRTTYYLLKVGQFLRAEKLSTSQAERIGWTKLQIIGAKINAKNTARLLKLAEENNAQELSREIREDSAKSKPHCVLLYFSTGQYRRFRRAVLRHGGSSAGRGLVGKEEAVIRIFRLAKDG